MDKSEKIMGMVGVEAKGETLREARAHGKIILSKEILNRIKDRDIPKGDVLEQSRLAGIIAAKKTHELIPLCHPLRLTNVKVSFEIVEDGVEVESYVAAVDRTGVEMEALVAVSAACLNIYDMCKKFDRGITIKDVCLVEKKGGASGDYVRNPLSPGRLCRNVKNGSRSL